MDAFRCAPDGSLVVKRKPHYIGGSDEELIAIVDAQVREQKRSFLERGILSFDDAIWVALSILRGHPDIARAIGGRFDELLLDEAQDTSELQLAAIEALRATGALKSLVLVGDLEQSIFSFQGASADGCRRLAEECHLEVLELTQNHRSSQRICDVAAHFCDRSNPTRRSVLTPTARSRPKSSSIRQTTRRRRSVSTGSGSTSTASIPSAPLCWPAGTPSSMS